jgi:hypothetical protein
MAMASTYISNRRSFWSRLIIAFEIAGYAKAAAELRRLGYHKEAENCLKMMQNLK